MRSRSDPTLLVLVGSLIIAWSGIFVRLADLSPATSAFYRCAYAVPPLVLLAVLHVRRHAHARLDRRAATWSSLAGLCFGADLVLWHVSIGAVGAGLATVLGNTQVVLVPLVAWLAWDERLTARVAIALPVVLAGIVLISGVVGGQAYGDAPVLGAVTGVLTGVAYAGFILCMRAGGRDAETPVSGLALSTAVAGVVAMVAGLATGSFEAIPSWPAHGWLLLLALSCQVFAWLLISSSLVRITASRVSLLLLLQPVTALVLGVLVLAEDPSAWQWIGAAVTLVGIVVGTRSPREAAETVPA